MEHSARYSEFRDTVAYRAGTRFKEHGFAIANWLGQEVEETKRGHFTREFWLLYDDPTLQPRRRWWSRPAEMKRLQVAHVMFDSYEAHEGNWLVEVYDERYLDLLQYMAAEIAALEGDDTTANVRLFPEASHDRNNVRVRRRR